MVDRPDLTAFVAVARTEGVPEAARGADASGSGSSEAIRRLGARLGVRLFNRTTRSIVATRR